VQPGYIGLGGPEGAWRYNPPLKDPEDIDRLHYPTIQVDEEATQRVFDATSEIFADLVPVHIHYSLPHANLCCEPYSHKFDMLQKIPRLRRVSVSPWCDIEEAAGWLKRNHIFREEIERWQAWHKNDPDPAGELQLL